MVKCKRKRMPKCKHCCDTGRVAVFVYGKREQKPCPHCAEESAHSAEHAWQDAKREMFGADADYLDDDIGAK